MKIRRPSGPTLVTLGLLVLLPALAVLQYRWVGQVSTAERERMQRNLRTAAGLFREGFDGEIVRAVLSLQVGPATAREGASERYTDRYDTWLNTAAHPQVVADVLLLDADAGQLRLRRWDAETHTFDSTPWPAVLTQGRPHFEQELSDFTAGRPFSRRPVFRDEESLIVTPLRNLVVPARPAPGPQTVTPVFGFTIIQLNVPYVREQMLPELAQRHFTHAEGDVYRVAVTSADDPKRVLFRSDPDAPVDPTRADATASLLGRSDPAFFFARPPRPPGDGDGDRDRDQDRGGSRRRGGNDGPNLSGGRPEDASGRWLLLIQHQSGSLEAAVASVRRRNLGISFGVLLLLTVSVALLAATSRRAHRLARQQMEFVAGVSHELRTPVAVIRSAAENLSHGVVSGDRVKSYGQLLETEAKRLGEMVERVLQYAGIESGLGFGARVALSPSEIIDGAIDSSVPLLDTAEIQVHREIATGLPPVLGDAAALRSAVQNLIANAVKYGGRDRWVGIRAEHATDRRRSEVRITVSDHGAGIPASELPHIFDPFYRGADAVDRQVHGNGLGLSLVKRIVNAHDGRVTVTTRAGAGSSFTISLPAAAHDARTGAVASELQTTHF
ncbi:MAG TPA: HAMP domain-containing sensor histidine kinase [Vicinamibacterales bacterium]|nr:HAMP domain-containing sensor histidine kinase [Vicinamibacterales bacterium]